MVTTERGTADQPKRWSNAGTMSRAMNPIEAKSMMMEGVAIQFLVLATLTMANVSQGFLFLVCAAMASEMSFLNC